MVDGIEAAEAPPTLPKRLEVPEGLGASADFPALPN